MSPTNEQSQERLRTSLQTLTLVIDKLAAASRAMVEAGESMRDLNVLMWNMHDEAAIRDGIHLLYKDGDLNIPKSIVDRDGRVTLAMCRLCGAAKSALAESTCPGSMGNETEYARQIPALAGAIEVDVCMRIVGNVEAGPIEGETPGSVKMGDKPCG